MWMIVCMSVILCIIDTGIVAHSAEVASITPFAYSRSPTECEETANTNHLVLIFPLPHVPHARHEYSWINDRKNGPTGCRWSVNGGQFVVLQNFEQKLTCQGGNVTQTVSNRTKRTKKQKNINGMTQIVFGSFAMKFVCLFVCLCLCFTAIESVKWRTVHFSFNEKWYRFLCCCSCEITSILVKLICENAQATLYWQWKCCYVRRLLSKQFSWDIAERWMAMA